MEEGREITKLYNYKFTNLKGKIVNDDLPYQGPRAQLTLELLLK